MTEFIIACLPVDTSKLVKPPGVVMPEPSIAHTIVVCPGCGKDCWIGPKQKEMAEAGQGEPRCYYCVMPIIENADAIEAVTLDPEHDTIPRRTTKTDNKAHPNNCAGCKKLLDWALTRSGTLKLSLIGMIEGLNFVDTAASFIRTDHAMSHPHVRGEDPRESTKKAVLATKIRGVPIGDCPTCYAQLDKDIRDDDFLTTLIQLDRPVRESLASHLGGFHALGHPSDQESEQIAQRFVKTLFQSGIDAAATAAVREAGRLQARKN